MLWHFHAVSDEGMRKNLKRTPTFTAASESGTILLSSSSAKR